MKWGDVVVSLRLAIHRTEFDAEITAFAKGGWAEGLCCLCLFKTHFSFRWGCGAEGHVKFWGGDHDRCESEYLQIHNKCVVEDPRGSEDG